MKVQLGLAVDGVSNFRDFQRENREFMGWFRANHEQWEETNRRRARLHYWWLGILSCIIVGSVLGAGGWLFSFLTTHHIASADAPISSSRR